VTREPSGPIGRMVPQVHVTCKPSGPTGRMEMENGPQVHVTRKPSGPRLDVEGSCRYTSDGERIEQRLL
jgi:hypothetical protein